MSSTANASPFPQAGLLSPEADGADPSTGRSVRMRFSPDATNDGTPAAASSVSFRPGPVPHDEILFPEEKGSVDRTPHDLPDQCDGVVLYFCEKPVSPPPAARVIVPTLLRNVLRLLPQEIVDLPCVLDCAQYILGRQWRCRICGDFDLCDDCFRCVSRRIGCVSRMLMIPRCWILRALFRRRLHLLAVAGVCSSSPRQWCASQPPR